jgi:hypothetical protein
VGLSAADGARGAGIVQASQADLLMFAGYRASFFLYIAVMDERAQFLFFTNLREKPKKMKLKPI